MTEIITLAGLFLAILTVLGFAYLAESAAKNYNWHLRFQHKCGHHEKLESKFMPICTGCGEFTADALQNDGRLIQTSSSIQKVAARRRLPFKWEIKEQGK
jgi:hypothetical protein